MHNQLSQIRIIGGKWRSRKIIFAAIPGLRPTPDRVRETLFNWLMPSINQAICLDLFAGSGALSFEALSRGAKSVLMIDQSPAVIAMLRKNAETLLATNAEFYCAKFPENLTGLVNRKFDIVFLDPPFNQNLIASSAHWLEINNCLAPNALIYMEAEATLKDLAIPESWQIIRHKQAGQVSYYLAQRSC